MGWSRRAKFGIHSSKTLRKYPTRKYHSGYYQYRKPNPNGCGQFAVIKELNENPDYPSNVKFDLDDGIPFDASRTSRNIRNGYPSDPLVHSLNKKNRWLLPDLVKESVENIYEEHVRETSKTVVKGKRDSDELRVTVVERHAGPWVKRYQADCFSLTSNCPSLSSTPIRKPNKIHAHVGDLRGKRNSASNEPELYYEFLSPFPKKNWPAHRQLDCYVRYDVGECVGSKAKKKCKGRRNKHYRHGVPLDEPLSHQVSALLDVTVDNVYPEKSSSKSSIPLLFPINYYINDAIKRKNSLDKRKKAKRCCTSSCSNTLSSLAQFGKGDAIVLDNDDRAMKQPSPLDEKENDLNKTFEIERCIEDKKSDILLLVQAIDPDNLKQEFGDNYVENAVFPRQFVIKADLNNISPNVLTNTVECFFLFNVSDKASDPEVVDAQIAISLPTTELLAKNVEECAKLELNRLPFDHPSTVKHVVNLISERIIDESRGECKKTYWSKKSSTFGTVPVEFIYEICQQKPKVCGLKKAVQYSPRSEKRGKVTPFEEENVDNSESCCEICLLTAEEHSIIPGASGFSRLLQCSHQFCNECWKLYIMSCIRAGQAHITCPHFNCKTTVGDALVWTSTNSTFYQRYLKIGVQLAVDTNPAVHPCPSPDCGNLAYVPSSKQSTSSLPVRCQCGAVWCFGCRNDAHWPASCEETAAFRKQCNYRDELWKLSRIKGRISSVQVKRCPHCSYPIEKGVGCQHMSCRCGNSFCWECLKPWDNHDWDNCDKHRKQLEEVELVVSIGSCRYNKYSKLSFANFLARNGKDFAIARDNAKKAKQVEECHPLVWENEQSSSSRLVRSYIKNNVSRHLQEILDFKCFAHFVLQNTAAALAVAKTKRMLRYLDKNIQTMGFIIGRLDEILSEPIALTEDKNLENVKNVLRRGREVIRAIYLLARANREH